MGIFEIYRAGFSISICFILFLGLLHFLHFILHVSLNFIKDRDKKYKNKVFDKIRNIEWMEENLSYDDRNLFVYGIPIFSASIWPIILIGIIYFSILLLLRFLYRLKTYLCEVNSYVHKHKNKKDYEKIEIKPPDWR